MYAKLERDAEEKEKKFRLEMQRKLEEADRLLSMRDTSCNVSVVSETPRHDGMMGGHIRQDSMLGFPSFQHHHSHNSPTHNGPLSPLTHHNYPYNPPLSPPRGQGQSPMHVPMHGALHGMNMNINLHTGTIATPPPLPP